MASCPNNEGTISFSKYDPEYYANEVKAYQWEVNNAAITGLSNRGIANAMDSVATWTDMYNARLKKLGR